MTGRSEYLSLVVNKQTQITPMSELVCRLTETQKFSLRNISAIKAGSNKPEPYQLKMNACRKPTVLPKDSFSSGFKQSVVRGSI